MPAPLVAAILTPGQQETVEFYQALTVAASWFVGVPDADGRVEVIAIGTDSDDGSFVWSIRIDPSGQSDTSEATVSVFSTGIDA